MILDEIVASTKKCIEERKNKLPIKELSKSVYAISGRNGFYDAISKNNISYICEVKKASPSKGVLCKNFNHIEIARKYEKIGASAISILTEKNYFKGDLKYLKEIRDNVTIPLLQKDFIVDEYQIFEARAYGADAILLICAILDENMIRNFIAIAHSLNMAALVETRNREEILIAQNAGAKIIGVNNRNLKTMKTNISTTYDLRRYVNEEILFISESGIKTREDIVALEKIHVNAVLMGETFMVSENKEEIMKKLKGISND